MEKKDIDRIIENAWEDGTLFISKKHPPNIGNKGNEEPRDCIAVKVTETYPLFFAYWKKVEKQLNKSI